MVIVNNNNITVCFFCFFYREPGTELICRNAALSSIETNMMDIVYQLVAAVQLKRCKEHLIPKKNRGKIALKVLEQITTEFEFDGCGVYQLSNKRQHHVLYV